MKTILLCVLFCLTSSLFAVSLIAQQRSGDLNCPTSQQYFLKKSTSAFPKEAARLRKRVQDKQII